MYTFSSHVSDVDILAILQAVAVVGAEIVAVVVTAFGVWDTVSIRKGRVNDQ